MTMMEGVVVQKQQRGGLSPSAEHLQGNTIFSLCVCVCVRVFGTDEFKADGGRKTG